MINKVTIKNFKSIKDSGEILFLDKLFVLAGQNESGKSSILEALNIYECEKFDKDTLNFEEEQHGNERQEISCTYTNESDNFYKDLVDSIKEDFSIDEEAFIDIEKLNTIREYTITKSFNHKDSSLTKSLNLPVFNLLQACINKKEHIATDEDGKETKSKVYILDISDEMEAIADILFNLSPKIVLFNTFSDLLPDKILISDLETNNAKAEGYNAVRSLEKLLNKDFVSISKLERTHKSSETAIEVQSLSDKFQKAWRQRIYDEGDLKIGFEIDNEDVEGKAVPTVFFSVQTKDNILLQPRKRSKGMIWFLSAWLDLKAREDDVDLVILYDEPGLYLHIKAHKDILELFNELIKKGHQIVYSTHSPSLIDTSVLYNIGLVLNNKETGTIVEGLTTSKIDTTNKQDALQPVAEAMGLEPLKDFSIFSKNNCIVEGISDFWYFNSMAKILDNNTNYKFVPGVGLCNGSIKHLISFCIGYGLDWLVVVDDGKNPQKTREILKNELFNDSDQDTDSKLKALPVKEIENLFTVEDLRLTGYQIPKPKTKEGKMVSDKRKFIISRTFAQKVDNGEITKDNISKTAIANFEEIFAWIEERFNSNNIPI